MITMRCPNGCKKRCGAQDKLCWFNGNDDIESMIEREQLRSNERVMALLFEENRPDLAANLASKLKEIDNGVDGAKSSWSALSSTQRRTLVEISQHGNRIERVGKEYLHQGCHRHNQPIYVATVRNLYARELLAWDGGAFDPEAAAVLTERGRFVLEHGNKNV